MSKRRPKRDDPMPVHLVPHGKGPTHRLCGTPWRRGEFCWYRCYSPGDPITDDVCRGCAVAAERAIEAQAAQ